MTTPLLDEIAPDLFATTSALKSGGVTFPLRTTVLRLPAGLWVHSPIPPPAGVAFEELAAAVASLGEVRWLVSPCLFHHVGLPAWAAAFPEADVWGPAGIEAKQASVTIAGHLEETLPAAWAEALTATKIAGAPQLEETAFFHAPSRSLIVADLLFNLEKVEGLMSKMVFGMAGTLNGPAQSRLVRVLTKDRAAAGESVRALLALDFDRLIMAHGAVIDTGGKAVLERACQWMLGAAPTTSATAAA